MLRPVRRRLAALAVVLLVPTLGACAYQTDQVYQPGVGVNNRAGKVDVLGAVVVSSTDGQGTFVASLVNKDQERSASLSGVTGQGVEAKLNVPIDINPDTLVNLANTSAVSLTGADIVTGKFVRLKLTFESGQETTVNVPVVPADAEFSQVSPANPSGSSNPSPSASPSS